MSTLQIGKTEAGTPVTLQHLLVFSTGADRELPLGFPTKASLEFLKEGDVLAIASTCNLILRVPIYIAFHDNRDRFKIFREDDAWQVLPNLPQTDLSLVIYLHLIIDMVFKIKIRHGI